MQDIKTSQIHNRITSRQLRFFSVLLLFVWLGSQCISTFAVHTESSQLELLDDEKKEEQKEKDEKDTIFSLQSFISSSGHDAFVFGNKTTPLWEPPYIKVLISPPNFS